MTAAAPQTSDAVDSPLVVPIDMGLVQEIPGFNSRKVLNGIEELAANISQTGQMMPVMVLAFSGLSEEDRARCQVKKGKSFGLVVGHRRFTAIDSLGWSSIDAKILPSTINLQNAKVLNLIENVQREDLSTYETAHSCLELHERFGMSHAQISGSLGKSKSYVGNLIRCASKLCPEILKYWEEGDPQAIVDYLVILAKVDHDKQREKWAEKKGLGATGGSEDPEENEDGEGEDGPQEPEQAPRRRPSPKRIAALSEWVKEHAPDPELERFALAVIKMCQGEQATISLPAGKGKRKLRFDIRNPPKPSAEE